MDRRAFLRYGALATGALALTPRWLQAFGDSDTAASFAAGRERYAWLQGWQNVRAANLPPTALRVEGRLPAALRGTLYRNGPAWFERAGFRYRHWFDGDGMIHAWNIDGGRITHRASMVATSKFQRESTAGRFLLPAAGTTVPDALSIRNNDDMNTANTAVVRFAGRLFALWEAGSAYELEPDSLRTRGAYAWREDLSGAPFSAHPLIDRDGSLWNFGSLAFLNANALLLWHIGADGKLLKQARVDCPAPGYLHSFTMTERHLVFVLMPFDSNERAGAFFERMHFRADRPCTIAVVAKDDFSDVRWFEADFAAIYHWADAYERDGVIFARAVLHSNVENARSPQSAAMRGESDPAPVLDTELVVLRIDLNRRQARWVQHGVHGVEFPTFDARTPGAGPRRIFLPTSVGRKPAPYFNALAAVDLQQDRVDRFTFGEHSMVEEYRFVSAPGSSVDGAGWLVGTVLDFARSRTGICVFDARHLSRGPLAQAWLEHSVPLGFHGWFAPA